jgi:adenylosuccinate synthase
LQDAQRFANKLREVLEYHNFLLQHLLRQPAVDFQQTLDEQLVLGERVLPLMTDVTGALAALRSRGANVMFEGAQGAMLDVDLGTYPFVTSSNTTAGYAATGTGLGPRSIDYVLGIVKAYATRVGGGPFPTELHDPTGEYLQRVGKEFGAVTGRRRRCGWLDAVALRRSLINSSVSGLCITKLDVLDGLDEIKVCVSYRCGGRIIESPPLSTEEFAACEPVFETLPGWKTSTVGITESERLPENARRYLDRMSQLVDTPIDVISTGPDRAQTIVLRHPFD